MKHIYRLFLFFCFSLSYASQWALWVEKLDIISHTDFFGDQIYFFILEKDKNDPVSYTTLPLFPFSYTQENLPYFEPAMLWEGDLSGGPKTLAISLIDREALPWIADEVLGNLQVTIEQSGQNLMLNWSALTESLTFDQNQESPLFQKVHVKYLNGEYTFDLKWKKVD